MTLLFIFSVLIASISQILLKLGSKNSSNLYLNKYTISGYVILVFSTLCTVIAYKKTNLSTGMLLESLSYIFVPCLSYYILKEKMSKKRVLGMIVIIAGILIFNI